MISKNIRDVLTVVIRSVTVVGRGRVPRVSWCLQTVTTLDIGKSSALCTLVMMAWSAALCVDRSVSDVIDLHQIRTGVKTTVRYRRTIQPSPLRPFDVSPWVCIGIVP